MTKNKTYLIIPAHNEAKNLPKVLAEVAKLKIPTVVIDDGSTDPTFSVASGYPVTVLKHAINLGYYETIKTGLQYSLSKGAQVVILLDSDGQHPATQVPNLVRHLAKSKSDLVIGSRFLSSSGLYHQPFYLKLITVLYSLNYTLFTGQKLSDTSSGFQAFNAKAANFLYHNYLATVFPVGNLILLHHSGFKISEYPVSMSQRLHGKSMRDSLLFYLLIPPQTIVSNLALLVRILFSRIAV